MNSIPRPAFALFVLLLLSVLPAQAQQSEIYANTSNGLAIGGYDPVAYFIDAAPLEGKAEFQVEWKGAPWRFASAENLALFEADPEAYAPQYGGWCAFAMAQGAFATTVPEAWSINDGKLHLNFSTGVRQDWLNHIDELLPRAEANWPY
jgi:YHS domain-containing protein